MQAILTKYIAASATMGSRIKASAAAGSVYMPYDAALSLDANHVEAARKLLKKLGWEKEGIVIQGTGSTPDGNYCHVLAFENK